MKYKQLTFNFEIWNLPIFFILSMWTLIINPKFIFTIWRKKNYYVTHLSRQDTHSTNFHRFLSGWIGPFDRILPIFLFTQMHNGPCWNKNFAHKECWPYIYILIKNSKMRYFISKIQFRGFGIFEDFFCTFFGGKNFLPW